MIFWGYFFATCSYLTYCIGRFLKLKKGMLLFDLLSKPLMAIALYFFNSLSGAYILLVACLVLIVSNIKERLHTRWLAAYILFQLLYLIIFYHTYIGLSSILITTCVSITLFSIWWLPPQKMRLIGGFNGLTSLTYHLSLHNWLGIMEVVVMASNFAAYFKMRKKRKSK